ncbi:MAG: hypothetical protein ABIQ31_26280, partial [Ferruginibacter sp.]
MSGIVAITPFKFHFHTLADAYFSLNLAVYLNDTDMKIVRVQYTTRPEYAATNQENIRQVVNELRALNHPGINYSTYLLPDGKTFMHL